MRAGRGLEDGRAFARAGPWRKDGPTMRKLGNVMLAVGLVAACQSPHRRLLRDGGPFSGDHAPSDLSPCFC